MTESAQWWSIHVHFHDETAERNLVLDAVRPAYQSVADRVEAFWFGRHWRQGPHLRLSFRCDAVTWESQVRPEVTAQVEDWLAAHRSRVRLDEIAARPVHRQLAQLEMEQGPLSPWIADNTVLEAPYDHRLHVLGSLAASELLAAFLADTTEPTFQMYDALRTGTPLPVLVLDLFWTTIAAAAIPFRRGEPPITRGFLSLRSHADAFLSRTSNPDAYRAAFDDKFERQRDALAERLREVEATLSGTGQVPFVAEWAELIRHHQRAAQPLLASGEVTMQGAALAPRMPTVQVSDFHRRLQGDHGHHDFISNDDWFASFRLVVNYLYVHCNRLGLKPLDRALLCHLAASTVETAYGRSALDAFEEHVASGPANHRPEWSALGAEWSSESE